MGTGHFIACAVAAAALILPSAAAAAEGDSIAGFYLGVHGGYAGGSVDWSGTPNPLPVPPLVSANTADHDSSGLLAGGTIGGRWQSGYVVLGLEAEASWADLEDSTPSTAFAGLVNRTQTDWLGTVTAHAGIQTGRVHFYVEAGAAFSGDEYSVTDTNGVAPDQSDSVSDTRGAVVIGTGFEYLMDGGWSVRGEYNYLNFGAKDYTLGGDTWSIDPTRHVLRLAFLYRFGGR